MTKYSLGNCGFIIIFTLIICAFTEPCFAADPSPFTVEVAEVGRSKELVATLATKGITAVVPTKNMRVVDEQTNCAIWIGKNVPLEKARIVLNQALDLYPYLQFFYVVGDRGEKPPATVDSTIHIGGSIEAAMMMKLNPIKPVELKKALATMTSLEQLHQYLHDINVPRAEVKP